MRLVDMAAQLLVTFSEIVVAVIMVWVFSTIFLEALVR